MKDQELNVKALPTFPEAHCTGEVGVIRVDERWERNGQQLIGPLSKLILMTQPHEPSWLHAAAAVTGWTVVRVFAFQSALSGFRLTGGLNGESEKGLTDAALYGLLHKLARKTNRQ